MAFVEVPTEVTLLASFALSGLALAPSKSRDVLATALRTPPNVVNASRMTRRARRLIASSPEVWQKIAEAPPRLRHNWSYIAPHALSEDRISIRRTPNLRQAVLHRWSSVEFLQPLQTYMPNRTRHALTDALFTEFWRQLPRERVGWTAYGDAHIISPFESDLFRVSMSPNLMPPFVREVAAMAGDSRLRHRKRIRTRIELTAQQFSSGLAGSFDNNLAAETGCYIVGLSSFEGAEDLANRVEDQWDECGDRGLRMHVVGIVHRDKIERIVGGLRDRIPRWEQHSRDFEVSEMLGNRSALSFSFVPR